MKKQYILIVALLFLVVLAHQGHTAITSLSDTTFSTRANASGNTGFENGGSGGTQTPLPGDDPVLADTCGMDFDINTKVGRDVGCQISGYGNSCSDYGLGCYHDGSFYNVNTCDKDYYSVEPNYAPQIGDISEVPEIGIMLQYPFKLYNCCVHVVSNIDSFVGCASDTPTCSSCEELNENDESELENNTVTCSKGGEDCVDVTKTKQKYEIAIEFKGCATSYDTSVSEYEFEQVTDLSDFDCCNDNDGTYCNTESMNTCDAVFDYEEFSKNYIDYAEELPAICSNEKISLTVPRTGCVGKDYYDEDILVPYCVFENETDAKKYVPCEDFYDSINCYDVWGCSANAIYNKIQDEEPYEWGVCYYKNKTGEFTARYVWLIQDTYCAEGIESDKNWKEGYIEGAEAFCVHSTTKKAYSKTGPDISPCTSGFPPTGTGSYYNDGEDALCEGDNERKKCMSNGEEKEYCAFDETSTKTYRTCGGADGKGYYVMFYKSSFDPEEKQYAAQSKHYEGEKFSTWGTCTFDCNATTSGEKCTGVQNYDETAICEIEIDKGLASITDIGGDIKNIKALYSLSSGYTANGSSKTSIDSRACLIAKGASYEEKTIYRVCDGYYSEGTCLDYLKGDIDKSDTCTFDEIKDGEDGTIYKCSCPTGYKTKAQLETDGIEGLDEKISSYKMVEDVCFAGCSISDLQNDTSSCEKYDSDFFKGDCPPPNVTDENGVLIDIIKINKGDPTTDGWYSKNNKPREPQFTCFDATKGYNVTYYRQYGLKEQHYDDRGSAGGTAARHDYTLYGEKEIQPKCEAVVYTTDNNVTIQGKVDTGGHVEIFYIDDMGQAVGYDLYYKCTYDRALPLNDICIDADGSLNSECVTDGKLSAVGPIDPTLGAFDPLTSNKHLYRYYAVNCPDTYFLIGTWKSNNNDYCTKHGNGDTFLTARLTENGSRLDDVYGPTKDAGVCNYTGYTEADNTKKIDPTFRYTEYALRCDLLGAYLSIEFSNSPLTAETGVTVAFDCHEHSTGEIKYFLSCAKGFKDPYDEYKPSEHSDDVCKFNGKNYYLYGGTCPVANEYTKIVANLRDYDKNYGTGSEYFECNSTGYRRYAVTCDPNTYTKRECKAPNDYKYGHGPKGLNCRIAPEGEKMSKTSPLYYASDSGVECQYSRCGDEIDNSSIPEGYVSEVVDNRNECVTLYGTDVKIEECYDETENKIKVTCWYDDASYKYHAGNCGIGHNLSGKYIVKNGIKYYDRCDCTAAYRYTSQNCGGTLGGNKCTQEIDEEFKTQRQGIIEGVETFASGANVDLYETCDTPAEENEPEDTEAESTCPENSRMNNDGNCVCNEGYVSDGKGCVLSETPTKEVESTCPENSSDDGTGNCVCDEGYVSDGKNCITGTPNTSADKECPANSSDDGTGNCVCKSGYMSDGKGGCIEEEFEVDPNCPENSTYDEIDKKCKCNKYYKLNAGKCERVNAGEEVNEEDTEIDPTCPLNSKFSDGVCVCDKGFVSDGKNGCKPEDKSAQITCPANSSDDGTGNCVCDKGYISDGDGGCKENVTETTCPANSKKDSDGNCVCDKGYISDGKGGCKENVTETTCPANSKEDEWGTCICNEGYISDGKGGCIEKPTAAWVGCYYCCPAGTSPSGKTKKTNKGLEFECR